MKCWVCKKHIKSAQRIPFAPNDVFRNVCNDCACARVVRDACGFVVKVYP